MRQDRISTAPIPMRWLGPIRITGEVVDDSVMVPLATYETPLWPSVGRGARVSCLSGGILATLIDERMTRSILLEAANATEAVRLWNQLQQRLEEMQALVRTSSRFARLIDMHHQIVGNLLYLRLEFSTGDASGHNMVTLASERLQSWILTQYPSCRYTSLSANFCTDKKTSAVNGILGRGKSVVCELTVPADICRRRLKTTPQAIVDINTRKNLLGSVLAGSLRSANAHFANMLLAFYLATGQDAANIVEGSQGVVHTEVRDEALYFSVNLPNLVVGTVGNGKGQMHRHAGEGVVDFVDDNLARLGCREAREPGANARRLAVICAASVLCGELSLLAALTNPGELMAAHLTLER